MLRAAGASLPFARRWEPDQSTHCPAATHGKRAALARRRRARPATWLRWLRALLAVSPADIPRIGEHGAAVGLDWRVLAFTLGVSVFTGILFGLFPAIGASRPDLNSTLKESSNRTGTGFHQSKARSLLVISEVSLALVLLIGAALLIRTFLALCNVNPGFQAHNVLTLEMSLTGDRFQKTAGVAQLVRNGRERLNAIPGVEISASVAVCRSKAALTCRSKLSAVRRINRGSRAPVG